MMTLKTFSSKVEAFPAPAVWYLSDLAEARGRQELFTKQAPQRLKVLREHALIESAISSNRIEGVHVDENRIGPVLFGKAQLRDRDEEEVRGYQNALKLIHEKGKSLSVSEKTIKALHQLARGKIWDAGKYKEKDSDIIERFQDGRERVRFKTVSAKKTPVFMRELISLWNVSQKERWVPPLIALTAFNLDFLCIHPFRDGNGRVSRLLLLLQCYHLGFEVGRYISLERIIEENKERYYETLEASSHGWHEGKHNPWHYMNFVLYILKTAYKEFEERAGQVHSPRGEKTALVMRAILRAPGIFHIRDIQRQSPGVSIDMLRKVLKDLQAGGRLKCLGRGQSARWEKTGKW